MASEQLNVLIIDDDPAMVELLSRIVTGEEHQVVTVGSAEEALSLLPVWTFHVAFIDHQLPEMEGLVFGEYLRRNNPDMKVALVTAEQGPGLARRAREHGITFIAKPFRNAEILAVLGEYATMAAERDRERRNQTSRDFAPPFAAHAAELGSAFDMPRVPSRIEDRLISTVKRALGDLRSAGRYTERERVIALSGLLAARVLGVDLPKASSGRTLYEEYDAIMIERGRRPEFDTPADSRR